jgi:hypothetical protein
MLNGSGSHSAYPFFKWHATPQNIQQYIDLITLILEYTNARRWVDIGLDCICETQARPYPASVTKVSDEKPGVLWDMCLCHGFLSSI